MKFEELPADTQIVAANTLAEAIKQNNPGKEQAESLAQMVGQAFIALYKSELI
ncbi:hypothetical protein ABMZ76_16335 [Morganella morganii]|uniref:hypothetical protein n=1 Tax=Morganella morganii TaxID=582 RepID=UPI0013A719C7|nr:hypothetical protein [Morganella morganii]QIC11605.1 hypothetical protein G3577_05930 [Morganella morganii]QIC11933.1 hypothetical protein G3577_07775 [Morganella morganii]